jgi:hypothetical protein
MMQNTSSNGPETSIASSPVGRVFIDAGVNATMSSRPKVGMAIDDLARPRRLTASSSTGMLRSWDWS